MVKISLLSIYFVAYNLEDEFDNLDLEEMEGGNVSELNRLIRNTSRNQTHHAEEETYLPCEFCDTPVPADELVLHQVRKTVFYKGMGKVTLPYQEPQTK